MLSLTLSPVCVKMITGLSPGALLSNVSREKCIANLYKLPTITIKGGKTHHSASVLVPICVDKGVVCLLYTLRSVSLDLSTRNCQLSFPGGKMNKNESVYDAALRETEEEIGVPPKDIQIWTKMSHVLSRETNLVITPVIGEIKNFDITKLKPNKDEVDEIFTVPIRVFCDINNHGCFRYNNEVTPVFSGGKHRVWGITATITHRFLYSLLPGELYIPGFLRKEFKLSDLTPPTKE